MLEDLIDIQGLDNISIWPLAWGWWVIISLFTISVSIGIFYWLRRLRYRTSWQYKAFMRLQDIQLQVQKHPAKIVLQNLSQELRKIAMLTTKREQCAGLIGVQWLQWLHDHDPSRFNWVTHGTLLVESQYMPQSIHADPEHLTQLVTAAKKWVQKC